MKTPTDFSPAFPSTNASTGGMTLRDYFAAKAMQTSLDHLTNSDIDKFQEKAFLMIAETAYVMADAMMKARVK